MQTIPKIGSLQIETVRRCNFHCVFCPRSLGQVVDLTPILPSSKRNEMGLATIESILKQVHELEPEFDGTVLPFLNGEPFLDKRMPTIMGMVRDIVPKAKVGFFSNGSLFTESLLASLKGLKIDFLALSIHSADPIRYKELTGAPLEPTLQSLDRLLEAITFHSIEVGQSWILSVGEEIEPLQALVASRYKAFWPVTSSLVWNYKGEIHYKERELNTSKCLRLRDVTILCDGSVCLCCMDQNAEVNFGNVNNLPLKDILSSDLSRKYREQEGKSLFPCNRCNML